MYFIPPIRIKTKRSEWSVGTSSSLVYQVINPPTSPLYRWVVYQRRHSNFTVLYNVTFYEQDLVYYTQTDYTRVYVLCICWIQNAVAFLLLDVRTGTFSGKFVAPTTDVCLRKVTSRRALGQTSIIIDIGEKMLLHCNTQSQVGREATLYDAIVSKEGANVKIVLKTELTIIFLTATVYP